MNTHASASPREQGRGTRSGARRFVGKAGRCGQHGHEGFVRQDLARIGRCWPGRLHGQRQRVAARSAQAALVVEVGRRSRLGVVDRVMRCILSQVMIPMSGQTAARRMIRMQRVLAVGVMTLRACVFGCHLGVMRRVCSAPQHGRGSEPLQGNRRHQHTCQEKAPAAHDSDSSESLRCSRESLARRAAAQAGWRRGCMHGTRRTGADAGTGAGWSGMASTAGISLRPMPRSASSRSDMPRNSAASRRATAEPSAAHRATRRRRKSRIRMP